MKPLRHLFGGVRLTWIGVIGLAVAAGAYTAAMALLPAAKNTSFADVTATFEVWICFGLFLILNSPTPLRSALHCFVFFLISQPLVYLLQVPFSPLGWQLLGYYPYWFVWTVLTLPMGYVGWFLKKDKWWGLLILTPVLLLLGWHFSLYFGLTRYWFPRHGLTALLCAGAMLLAPLVCFRVKRLQRIGCAIALAILLAAAALSLARPNVYSTDVLTSGGSAGAVFDDAYAAALTDPRLGDVSIRYDSAIETWLVRADFVRGGKTELILTAPDGAQTRFALSVGYDTFTISPAP